MTHGPLRILSSCATWQGATDYGFLRAFRRAGHSVVNLPETDFFPAWRSPPLRLARRALRPLFVSDYGRALVDAARALRPHLFFVYKGTSVDAATIDAIRAGGAIAVNVYPDFSFTLHGPTLPAALPHYDWIFTTKSWSLDALARLGARNASFLPHGFDPETHFPATLDAEEDDFYRCDAAFIGAWSPKKEALLRGLMERAPRLDLAVWGNSWERAGPPLARHVKGHGVIGREYAKAIGGAKIVISLLSEAQGDAVSGDVTTTRTFEIPAAGGFMLHERTAEARDFFAEDRECAMFDGPDELAAKVAFWLAQDAAREAIAQAGRARSLACGYGVDERAAQALEKVRELLAQRAAP